MLYVVLVAFFLLMGKMIRDNSRAETESTAMNNFYRSEYMVPYAK